MATTKTTETDKIAVSARLDAADYHRAETIRKRDGLTMAEFVRRACMNEINRVAGALPRKEPNLVDVLQRLDAITAKLDVAFNEGRTDQKDVQFLVSGVDSICAALGLKD